MRNPANTEMYMEPGQAPMAPQAVQQDYNNDAAIGAFAESFMQDMDQQDGRAPENPPQTQDEPTQEAETETTETEAEAQPDEEVEALEIDGAEYQLPKALAERVKELKNSGLRQDDYTRKTQEVAESRKQLERAAYEAIRLQENAKQLAPAYAQVHAMAARAQAIRGQLTQELRANDPIEFNSLQSEFAILTNELNIAGGQIQNMEHQLSAQRNQVRQQIMAEQIPSLMKEIPELAKEDVRSGLRDFAASQGLPDSAIEEISFMPAAVKLLYKAQQYDKLMSQQAQAKQSLKAKVQSVPPVKGGKPGQTDARQQSMKAWKAKGGKFTDANLDSLLPKF